jgi:hypothetical protein
MCRDPFNLVISSYNYHTQLHRPEKYWTYRYKSLAPSENAARYVIHFIDCRRREFRRSI